MRGQSERCIAHKAGDLLWREKVGWAVCLVDTQAKTGQSIRVRLRGVEKNVLSGYYVNVSDLASRDAGIGNLIGHVRLAMSS